MPLTCPIPDEAMAVVEVIRRDVPKPKRLPILTVAICGSGVLRYIDGCCPMGLHPKSIVVTPTDSKGFAGGACTDEAVDSFFNWFDQQSDPQAATNALWPLPQPETASVESTESNDE